MSRPHSGSETLPRGRRDRVVRALKGFEQCTLQLSSKLALGTLIRLLSNPPSLRFFAGFVPKRGCLLFAILGSVVK